MKAIINCFYDMGHKQHQLGMPKDNRKVKTGKESAVAQYWKNVTIPARLMGLIQIAVTVLWIHWPWTLQYGKQDNLSMDLTPLPEQQARCDPAIGWKWNPFKLQHRPEEAQSCDSMTKKYNFR